MGLSGVLAASLRGSGQISTYIGLISCEEEIGSGTRHVVVSAGLSADLVLQALIFKWSGNIWSEDWPALYDNWKPSNNMRQIAIFTHKRILQPKPHQHPPKISLENPFNPLSLPI